jgi:hypothetical protein
LVAAGIGALFTIVTPGGAGLLLRRQVCAHSWPLLLLPVAGWALLILPVLAPDSIDTLPLTVIVVDDVLSLRPIASRRDKLVVVSGEQPPIE